MMEVDAAGNPVNPGDGNEAGPIKVSFGANDEENAPLGSEVQPDGSVVTVNAGLEEVGGEPSSQAQAPAKKKKKKKKKKATANVASNDLDGDEQALAAQAQQNEGGIQPPLDEEEEAQRQAELEE